MKPSAYYDRVVDVMEELVKFTLLTRDRTEYLTTATASARRQARRPPPRTSPRSPRSKADRAPSKSLASTATQRS